MNLGDEAGKRQKTNKFSVFYDLYVDLLGSMIPGLFTVIVGGVMLMFSFAPLYMFYVKKGVAVYFASKHIAGSVVASNDSDVIDNNSIIAAMNALVQLISSFHWELSIISIIIAYIIGAIFYRQDPKKPDAASALKAWMSSKKKERHELAVQAAKELPLCLWHIDQEDKPSMFSRFIVSIRPDKFSKSCGIDTQFPYLGLRCYLSARGLNHLLRFVPWCHLDENTHRYRTKMYINIIKIRLSGLFPELITDIIRNEAHVRLAISVWYASLSLVFFSLFILLVQFFMFLPYFGELYGIIYVSIVSPLFVIVFCVLIIHYLNKCVHYMRVREVIYVLEVAHMAEEISGKKLFSDIVEKDCSNSCMKCKKRTVVDEGSEADKISKHNELRMFKLFH
jgi:hypothetical protein